MKPPVGYDAVTTPDVVTDLQTNGLVSVVPWISAIVCSVVGGSVSGPLGPPRVVCSGDRGLGLRSSELLSVSVPVAVRASAVVVDVAGAAAVSKVLLVPKPTRSARRVTGERAGGRGGQGGRLVGEEDGAGGAAQG